jgi:ParB-like chromosome segregation protein Spo0J
VPVEFLRTNPRNRASTFSRRTGRAAASIRQHGIIQPIVVRDFPALPDAYEIVQASGAGEPHSAPSCTRFR